MTLHPIFRVLLFYAAVTIAPSAGVLAQPFFDYDNRADLGVFRPNDRNWYTASSESEITSVRSWGLATDRLVPGDYDGDGLTDLAVWRPESGIWYVLGTRDSQLLTVNWGTRLFIPNGWSSDEPVPGDYDGDGNDDFAVWRPGTGEWFVLRSLSGFNPQYASVFRWGRLGDIPVQADYDGDRRTDQAVFRSTENRWYVHQSSDGKWRTSVFGQAGFDRLVPADYDGDGRADFAVFRDGAWLIESSSDGTRLSIRFGIASDVAAPADYDGDGRTDPAVYRSGRWFILNSGSETWTACDFGAANDVPLASLRTKPSIVGIP